MKVLALDYGSARTGVAVSDPTGTVARPVGVVEHAGTDVGLARLVELIREHEAEELREDLARARKEAKKGPKASAEADIEFRDESDGIVTAEVKALKGPALRELSDQIRQSKQANAVLLGSVDDGRAYLVVNLDQRVVEKGADAVSIVKEAAKKIDGGGGGKPTLAEAGGKNPDGLAEAYEVGRSEIASALKG